MLYGDDLRYGYDLWCGELCGWTRSAAEQALAPVVADIEGGNPEEEEYEGCYGEDKCQDFI